MPPGNKSATQRARRHKYEASWQREHTARSSPTELRHSLGNRVSHLGPPINPRSRMARCFGEWADDLQPFTGRARPH